MLMHDMDERTLIYSSEICEFETIRRKQSKNHIIVCIDGRKTSEDKGAGYCKYIGHPGFLTEKLCKYHDCKNKECIHFLPKSKSSQSEGIRIPISVMTELNICINY